MKREIRNTLEMLIRVSELPANVTLPGNPLADDLFARVTSVVSEMEFHATSQVSGQQTSAGGTDDRQRLADRLRDRLHPVTRTARTLNPNEYPGATGQFRMPRSNGYQALLAAARAMLENVPSIKDALIARGMPADFDQQITDAINALSAATDRKFRGLIVQVAGTAGLADAARRGRKLVRELDAIMRNLLCQQPDLLASWLTASHIQRAPERTQEPPQPAAPIAVTAPSAPTDGKPLAIQSQSRDAATETPSPANMCSASPLRLFASSRLNNETSKHPLGVTDPVAPRIRV